MRAALCHARRARMAKFAVTEVCALKAKMGNLHNATAKMGSRVHRAARHAQHQVGEFAVDMANANTINWMAMPRAPAMMSTQGRPVGRVAHAMKMVPSAMAMGSAY